MCLHMSFPQKSSLQAGKQPAGCGGVRLTARSGHEERHQLRAPPYPNPLGGDGPSGRLWDAGPRHQPWGPAPPEPRGWQPLQWDAGGTEAMKKLLAHISENIRKIKSATAFTASKHLLIFQSNRRIFFGGPTLDLCQVAGGCQENVCVESCS